MKEAASSLTLNLEGDSNLGQPEGVVDLSARHILGLPDFIPSEHASPVRLDGSYIGASVFELLATDVSGIELKDNGDKGTKQSTGNQTPTEPVSDPDFVEELTDD